MNNNFNIIRKFKERILKNFYPVYHAPLIFDINTQSTYRKAGYVSWPKAQTSGFTKNKAEEEKPKSMSGSGSYFAYPKSKLKIG